MRTILSNLKPEFSFAGFTFPRHVARLQRGQLRERLKARVMGCCGEYYHSPRPNNRDGIGFYLGSDSQFSLRWQWAGREYSSGDDSFRGLVFTLPHSRGFLAGWSMGEHMSSSVDFQIFDSAEDAAQCADSMAENAAERQAEDSERFTAMSLAEIDAEEKLLEVQKAFALRHRAKFGGPGRVRDAIETLRNARETLADATQAYERGA